MSSPSLIDTEKPLFRGNLQTHSTASDGDSEPEVVCAKHRRAGNHFLSLSDHFIDRFGCIDTGIREFDTRGRITIPGAELHTGRTEFGFEWHILANGLPEDFDGCAPRESMPSRVRRAAHAGAFVSVAHLCPYNVSTSDILCLGTDVHAIEIHNGTCDLQAERGDSWHVADQLVSMGKHYGFVATDDFRGRAAQGYLAPEWVWVRAAEPLASPFVTAPKKGAFYSSTGPQIHHMHIENWRHLSVFCRVTEQIIAGGTGLERRHVIRPRVTEAMIDLSRFESPLVRITVRDRHGGRAWTNAMWLD